MARGDGGGDQKASAAARRGGGSLMFGRRGSVQVAAGRESERADQRNLPSIASLRQTDRTERRALELTAAERQKILRKASSEFIKTPASDEDGRAVLAAVGIDMLYPLAQAPDPSKIGADQATKLLAEIEREFYEDVAAERWQRFCADRAFDQDDDAREIWAVLGARPSHSNLIARSELGPLLTGSDENLREQVAALVWRDAARGEIVRDIEQALLRAKKQVAGELEAQAAAWAKAVRSRLSRFFYPYRIKGAEIGRKLAPLTGETIPDRADTYQAARAGALALTEIISRCEGREWLDSTYQGDVWNSKYADEILEAVESKLPSKNRLSSYSSARLEPAEERIPGDEQAEARADKIVLHAAALTGLSEREAARALANSIQHLRRERERVAATLLSSPGEQRPRSKQVALSQADNTLYQEMSRLAPLFEIAA